MCLAQSLLDWCWINQICVLIDWTYFSTDRRSVREFIKTWAFHMFFTFSKVFKKIFSLSSTDLESLSIFCHFPSNCFQGFYHLAPLRPFYHFSFFMHIFMHFRDIFGPSNFWGFLMFEMISFKIDQWVFVIEWCNHVSHDLFWSIWWIGKNWKL